MEQLSFIFPAAREAGGSKPMAIVGVVASGNLEALFERTDDESACRVEISTAAHGFQPLWEAVLRDFVARGAGGLRISINDGGARPDMVALRLAQGLRLMQGPEA
ncbi:MAG: malonate decarboxylase acyl carrier protein [Rhodospirillales bacterium]|nr:malonate decarboxylase acyl carrier protein [Rhodospirillales bacterium]